MRACSNQKLFKIKIFWLISFAFAGCLLVSRECCHQDRVQWPLVYSHLDRNKGNLQRKSASLFAMLNSSLSLDDEPFEETAPKTIPSMLKIWCKTNKQHLPTIPGDKGSKSLGEMERTYGRRVLWQKLQASNDINPTLAEFRETTQPCWHCHREVEQYYWGWTIIIRDYQEEWTVDHRVDHRVDR